MKNFIGAQPRATASIKINRIYKKKYDRWFTPAQLRRYEFFLKIKGLFKHG